MSVTDDFREQHKGENSYSSLDAFAEDQPDNITPMAARQRKLNNLWQFPSSDEVIGQFERIGKLVEAQAKFLSDMQASFKEALAGQLTRQSLEQKDLLLSFKETMIEQRDQMSKIHVSLMEAILENSKTQISLMSSVVEQRDQLSKMQASFSEQGRISPGIDNRANQPSLNSTQPTASELEQNKPTSKHITCMVAMPFKDNENTFAYKSVLLPALRRILERPPYCWQVIRADEIHLEDNIPDNIRVLMNQVDAYIVDISDENPNVMMELGFMRWSKKPKQPLVVLKRKDTGGYLADLAGYFLKTYPATKAIGESAINDVVNDLDKEFHSHQLIQDLNKTNRLHYLSSVFLSRDCAMNDELAYKLSQEFTTMEAVEAVTEEEYHRRTNGLQPVELIDAARQVIIRKLKDLRASQ